MSTSVPPPGYVPPPNPSPPDEPQVTSAPARSSPRTKLIVGGLAIGAIVCAAFLLFGSSGVQFTGPIARAATISEATPGYRMHMTMAVSVPMLSAPVTASADGVVDLTDHAASMSMAMDFSQMPQAAQALGTTTMRMGFIQDGAVIYVKLPNALATSVPGLAERPWVKMDLAKLSGIPGLSSMMSNPTMSDPTQMLRYLRAGSDGVINEGNARIDGIETTHYRAQLNLDRLTAGLPSAEQRAIHAALSRLEQATSVHDFPIDVWIDSRQLVRRVVMSLELSSANGQAFQETVTADLTDYGPQHRPSPPPADQVQDIGGSSALGAPGGPAGIAGG